MTVYKSHALAPSEKSAECKTKGIILPVWEQARCRQIRIGSYRYPGGTIQGVSCRASYKALQGVETGLKFRIRIRMFTWRRQK